MIARDLARIPAGTDCTFVLHVLSGAAVEAVL